MDLEVLATTQALQLEKEPGMASNPCQLRPESRGSIHAKSPDGMVNAEDRAELLLRPDRPGDGGRAAEGDPHDLEAAGDRTIHGGHGRSVRRTDQAMFEYAKIAAGTVYHPVGTVAMGDERFPLTPELKVRGVEGLRVIDARVFPRSPAATPTRRQS